MRMKEFKVCLHKKGAHTLERTMGHMGVWGVWFLDGNIISQEEAIQLLVEAVDDLGYWCQVAKDVLPPEHFNEVQYAYEYEEEGDL